MVLWRCLSHPHSLCEGHSQSPQGVWAKARLVPKDGGVTTPLWAVYCHPIVLEQCFPPVSSEIPVLQKSLLALVLSLSTSEKVWLCIHCLSHRVGYYLFFLLWAEEAYLPWCLLTHHMLLSGGSPWAKACHHLSHTGDTNWAQCSTYSLGSAWQQGTQP